MLTMPGESERIGDSPLLWRLNGVYAVAYLVAVEGPRFLPPGFAVRFLVGLVPILVFAWFVLAEMRAILRMDEMNRRIRMEAMAIAYPISLLLVMALIVFQRLIELPLADWGFRVLLLTVILPYVIGLQLVRKRYQ